MWGTTCQLISYVPVSSGYCTAFCLIFSSMGASITKVCIWDLCTRNNSQVVSATMVPRLSPLVGSKEINKTQA